MARVIKVKVPMFRLIIGKVVNNKFRFNKSEHSALEAAITAGRAALKTGGAVEIIVAKRLVAA